MPTPITAIAEEQTRGGRKILWCEPDTVTFIVTDSFGSALEGGYHTFANESDPRGHQGRELRATDKREGHEHILELEGYAPQSIGEQLPTFAEVEGKYLDKDSDEPVPTHHQHRS